MSDWLHGVVVNPLAGNVIVDTGPFTSEVGRTPCAWIAATAAAVGRFQWIDTDGTTVISEQYMPVNANGMQIFSPYLSTGGGVLTLQGQRFRMIVAGAVVGAVSASIYVPESV